MSNVNPSTLNLKTLPHDFFTNLGPFLHLKQICKLITELKLPKTLKLLPTRHVIVEDASEKKLLYLHEYAPNIKVLTIYQIGLYLHDSRRNYLNIHPLANFTKLESLEFAIPSQSYGMFWCRLSTADWSLLHNLRYLGIHLPFLLVTDSSFSNMITNFRKLEHLTLYNFNNNYLPVSGVSINIKTLEFSPSDCLKFDYSNFPNLKRIVCDVPNPPLLLENSRGTLNLEVLEMGYNYRFRKSILTEMNLEDSSFVKVKYLKVATYDLSHDDIMHNIQWNNLEFIHFRCDWSFCDAEKLIFSLKNLKYLFIDTIYLSQERYKRLLPLLKQLKVKFPSLIIGFQKLEFVFEIVLYEFITLFDFSNGYHNSNVYFLKTPQFTPEKWLDQHGYYLRPNASECI